jgi:hypothetical protein
MRRVGTMAEEMEIDVEQNAMTEEVELDLKQYTGKITNHMPQPPASRSPPRLTASPAHRRRRPNH